MGTRRCSPRPMGPTARSPELLSGTHCRWDPRGWTPGVPHVLSPGDGGSRGLEGPGAGGGRRSWDTPPGVNGDRVQPPEKRAPVSPLHTGRRGAATGWGAPFWVALPGLRSHRPGAHLPCGAGRAGLSPTCRCSREDAPAVAAISTPSSFLVRNMSPRYQGTEMVTSRSLQDTTLSPLKRWGCGMTVDRDGTRSQPGPGRAPQERREETPGFFVSTLRPVSDSSREASDPESRSPGLCRRPPWDTRHIPGGARPGVPHRGQGTARGSQAGSRQSGAAQGAWAQRTGCRGACEPSPPVPSHTCHPVGECEPAANPERVPGPDTPAVTWGLDRLPTPSSQVPGEGPDTARPLHG